MENKIVSGEDTIFTSIFYFANLTIDNFQRLKLQ